MRRGCRILLLCSLFVLLPFVAAQGGVLLAGTVLNDVSGLPIADLTVTLIDGQGVRLPTDPATAQNVTDVGGRFTIPGVIPNAWYGIEVHAGTIQRFTDYIFVDAAGAMLDAQGRPVVELDAPIRLTLQRN